jgi:hypothetical protein
MLLLEQTMHLAKIMSLFSRTILFYSHHHHHRRRHRHHPRHPVTAIMKIYSNEPVQKINFKRANIKGKTEKRNQKEKEIEKERHKQKTTNYNIQVDGDGVVCT